MKYLGSLRCSSVSAFRFGFIDLTWGWGLGGQLRLVWQSAVPSPWESFRLRQPRYFPGYFFPPWPFLQSALGYT